MNLRGLFNRDPMNRKIFAVREGTHKGSFFVYISTTEDEYNFLVLPDNTVENIKIEQFKQGVSKKIVDYIEKLPNNVYEICRAQYNESKAKSNINRLKQSTASSSVDSGECKKER